VVQRSPQAAVPGVRALPHRRPQRRGGPRGSVVPAVHAKQVLEVLAPGSAVPVGGDGRRLRRLRTTRAALALSRL